MYKGLDIRECLKNLGLKVLQPAEVQGRKEKIGSNEDGEVPRSQRCPIY